MPLTATFTEETVRGIAPDEATFKKAGEIARSGKFANLGVSADGSWLLGEFAGVAALPYQLSADFHDPAIPVLRSNSPSRVTPDKFSLGLLLSYLQDPDAFAPREPGDELLIKREKKLAMDEKKKTGSAAPRKISKTAPDKKLTAQRDALEVLERLLVEMVAGGVWFSPQHVEKVEKLSKQISDASIPAATFGLRRLQLIAKQKDLNEDDKVIAGTDVIAAIWSAVKRTRATLAGKPIENDADALYEDLTGKTWQTNDLREKGCVLTELSLLELAFERIDDEARQQRLEVSNLLDLTSGQIYQAIANRPFKGLNQIPQQTSYMTPLTVPEGSLVPGFVNRRLRWEKGSEHLNENPPGDLLEKALGLARTDFKEALAEFRAQLKQPLAPRDAVFFLRCEKLGKVGDKVIIADADGTRVELKDRRKDYSNVANLVRAAGMIGKDKPAVLVRFYVLPLTNMVLAVPLAAVSAKHHLRLGV